MARRRYAIVGTGGRHGMYRNALVDRFGNEAELVALCDNNPGRLGLSVATVRERAGIDVAGYAADEFDALLGESHPDVVIVTTMDSAHDEYICRAVDAGCDVVTEKPLTTTPAKLRRILDAQGRTGRSITVAFNYRYSPVRSQVKRLLADGIVGEITAVDFHWLLDTRHGADYFRRWHRVRANSGGLLVHKATHHFDLVNWWLDTVPDTVHATGDRRFYRPEQADRLGLHGRGERCLGCEARDRCPFHFDLASRQSLKATYLDQEHHDGYHRDGCVFSADIDIEDSMSVRVLYRNGCHADLFVDRVRAVEGYQIAFNGTRGRLEHDVRESSYASGDGSIPGATVGAAIRVYPHFAEPYEVASERASGGHGGGDGLLLEDLFDQGANDDPLGRRADFRAGAWAASVGMAANISMAEERGVGAGEIVGGLLPARAV